MSELVSGTRLGPYEIEAPLGAGGMGEVYRATDIRLGRAVAIKVLPADLTADEDRVRRFEQEARSASGLSHPHIVAIHDIGHENLPSGISSEAESSQGATTSVRFIAMELVDGTTLKAKIHQDNAPLKDLLRWLSQAADGLAKAHAAGIVHRDLKPDNIMITRDGYAKVLDFGLAKLTEPLQGGSNAPTALADKTAKGAVLGTVGYMAPEQVQGLEVDPRADIFALGCILYEAATRQRPFQGETVVDTMHQILRQPPTPIRQLNPEVPTALRRLIRRCLIKDPNRRLQSMKDLALELADIVEDYDDLTLGSGSQAWSSAGGLQPIVESWWRRRAWLMLAGALVLGAAAALVIRALLPGNAPAPREASAAPSNFERLTTQSGVESHPALSPDGAFVAYVAEGQAKDADIYLLRVGGSKAIDLTETSTVDDTAPAFSPDGQTIAFRSERDGGGLFVMGATGESVRRLTSGGYDPAWSPDGKQIVFAGEGVIDPYARQTVSALSVVAATGGEVKKLYAGDAVQPKWSPHGQRIAFWGLLTTDSGQRDIATVAADGGDLVRVTNDTSVDWNPVWSEDGRYLYFASDRSGSMNLWRVRIDEVTGKILGEPVPATAPSLWAGYIATSLYAKKLAFVSDESRSNIESLGFDAASLRLTGAPSPVTRGSNQIGETQISPSGDWLATRQTIGRQEDLWLVRADGSGESRQLTNDLYKDRGPSWSADGKEIYFYSDRSGRYEMWSIRPDGSGLRQLTATQGRPWWFPVGSPDGEHLVVSNELGTAIVRLDPTKPATEIQPLPPLPGGKVFSGVAWSPDGTLLVGEVAADLNSPADAIAIYNLTTKSYKVWPTNGLSGFRGENWLPDGRHVLYQDEKGLAVLDVESGQIEPVSGLPEDTRLVDVARDGNTLYLVHQSPEADIWMADLK